MNETFDSLFASARAALAGAPRETLGELQEGRRILGIRRAARIVPHGSAWHLGVLLLTDDAVLATGEVVRAREEAIRGFTAQSQRDRAERAGAAFRGGIPEGSPVHVDWRVLDPDAADGQSAPLAVRDGIPSVRWTAAGGYVPLGSYLAERIELLKHPPGGAT